MAQLKMYWKNDCTESLLPALPEGITLKTFPEFPEALTAWQDIMRFLAKDGDLETGGDYYQKTMLDLPDYKEDLCYFLFVNNKPAATLAVVCNYETKQGCIHMVACKPEFRGLGLGHLLIKTGVYTLKREGMETARLSTDDWRIPAIKVYLKAGFEPDTVAEPDYKERWEKIYTIIHN